MFIFNKKAEAMLLQIRESIKIFKELSEISYLVRVLVLSDEQAYKEKDAMRMSSRSVELLEMVR